MTNNPTKSVCWTAALVTTFATLVACKQDPPAAKTTPIADPQSTAAAPAVNAVSLADEDKRFITKAAQGGMVEVELGQLAAQKGASPAVKAFGAHMVDDHGKANAELAQLAAKKGYQAPVTLDADHRSTVDSMAKLSGAEFDKKYTANMVDDHEEDLKEFKDAAKDVKDPDLRAWAAGKVSTLDGHLTMAKDAKAKAKAE